MGEIYNMSKFYNILRAYGRLLFRVYYKKIVITGRENITNNTPLIFAPNHQNALMDPLAIIFTTKHLVVFLARADVFRNKHLAWLLRKFKIMPVYRLRDGSENLYKNDKTFRESIEILKNKKALGLFPEASHTDKRSLLPLKKAIPRIAFMAESENKFSMNIHVIPVGIYYSNYSNLRTILQVNYGKPIAISDYKKLYEENERKATLEFNQVLEERLDSLVINIKDVEYYDMYEGLREVFSKRMVEKMKLGDTNRQENKFIAYRKIIEKTYNYFEKKHETEEKIDLSRICIEYFEGLKKLKLSDWILEKGKFSFLPILVNCALLLLLLPLHIYGILTNIIVYKAINSFLNKKIKDRQFHSSIKFAFGFLVLPFYYLILTIILNFFVDFFYSLLFFASLPLAGVFSFEYFVWSQRLYAKIRFATAKRAKNPELLRLIALRQSICNKMENIIES